MGREESSHSSANGLHLLLKDLNWGGTSGSGKYTCDTGKILSLTHQGHILSELSALCSEEWWRNVKRKEQLVLRKEQLVLCKKASIERLRCFHLGKTASESE